MIVMYPPPTDIDKFESIYHAEHVPMAIAKLDGKTKIVATKVFGSPQKAAVFHRIAEVHFPSMGVLEACAASEGGRQVLAHAASISSGGPPVILVAEEETVDFAK
jgi:uncharacterized protein (TIGR02118 family)